MSAYNNLTQQAPMYPQYGYYQRGVPVMQEAQNPMPMQGAPTFTPPSFQQMNYIKGRPVVSIDEARASQIDLDGSLYVFPDLSNKKIYTKQINMDGTASFNIFELAVPSEPAPQPVYVTRTELEEILASFKANLGLDTAAQKAPVKNYNL